MKLVSQKTLYLCEGTSDKVYQVDLCEVGSGLFVVNFRYGRRGTTLKEGTKTPSPLSREDAQETFDELVTSKTRKGYSEQAPTVPSGSTPRKEASAAPTSLEAKVRKAIARRVKAGHDDEGTWSLSRAVWRAGELGMADLEKTLLKLLGSEGPMLDYSIVWALGRAGTTEAVPALRRLLAHADTPAMVRRIAQAALLARLEPHDRELEVARILDFLPEVEKTLVLEGREEDLCRSLDAALRENNPALADTLESLALIDLPVARRVLERFLSSAPPRQHCFKAMRHIYKLAEMRRDGKVFGILARCFEKSAPNYRVSYWHKRGAERQPFSNRTKDYLRRRTWRTLKRLGECGHSDYVKLASGALLAFSDHDASGPRQWSTYSYAERAYKVVHYDSFCNYWTFSHILYGKSPRYQATPKNFRCRAPYKPGDPAPDQREESFPDLWRQQPASVVDLLEQSKCAPVHLFGVKVLRSCPDFCSQLETERVIRLILAAYDPTAALGFELAAQRIAGGSPDARLIVAAANCRLKDARARAHSWIEERRGSFLSDAASLLELLTSPYQDTRQYVSRLMQRCGLDVEFSKSFLSRAFAYLLSLPSGASDNDVAASVADALLSTFPALLAELGAPVLEDLLAHPLPALQRFAGELVLLNPSLRATPPAHLLRQLMSSQHPEVREIGLRIFAQLPDAVLLNTPETLVALLTHALSDVRQQVRPLARRLAAADSAFAYTLAGLLVEALLIPGAPDGVPTETARLLCDDLRTHTGMIPPEKVWQLLHSRSHPAQEVGGVLLSTRIDARELTVEAIVKLSDHDILSVRTAARGFCDAEFSRVLDGIDEVVPMLDSRWEDTREFAKNLLSERVPRDRLTPRVLVSLCDSTRPDVQQFGTALITRWFSEDGGAEFLLKLSEHPAAAMQLFVTNYLDRYASGDISRLQSLRPYFLSVLGRVHSGRIAKNRVLQLLSREARANEESARFVAELLSRQSATGLLQDKEDILECLLMIQETYPTISTGLVLPETEVRSGI